MGVDETLRLRIATAQKEAEQLVHVAILVPEHALGWTVMGPADMLNSAGTLWQSLQGEHGGAKRFAVSIVGRSHHPVACFQGTRLVPQVLLDDPSYRPDVILVPALFEESLRFGRSGWSTPWRPFVEWIRAGHERGALVCAISTGAALLAETRLLDGRKATTHWAMVEAMAANYAQIEFVRNPGLQSAGFGSRLMTTAAGTAWQSLVLLLVSRYLGAQQAVELARLFSAQLPSLDGGSYGGFVPVTDHADAQVLRAQRVIATDYRDLDVLTEASQSAGLPRRTFERRFRAATGFSPLVYLHEIRIQHARTLLESTTRSIDDIAQLVGYGDVPHFRSLFFRKSGLTPSRYREKFGMGGMLEVAQAVL